MHSAGVSSFTFLSTPSARRATRRALLQRQQSKHFYPRPPRGGRQAISAEVALIRKFLSTPSARRATFSSRSAYLRRKISIHALREEGDEPRLLHHPLRQVISIHALREEGDDEVRYPGHEGQGHFYPRPPRGGRQRRLCHHREEPSISIHALREEGDELALPTELKHPNFYPRPPRGGRPACRDCKTCRTDFYPRPPRGGRQQKQRQNLYFQTNYTTFCTNLEEL